MPILKDNFIISSLDEWEAHAGPKRADQWVDGRSAKETARAWLVCDRNQFPPEVARVLASNSYFGTVSSWIAEPEAKLRFDSFAGETRNCDIAIHAKDKHGPYLIAVEAKADEPFSETIQKTRLDAQKRLSKNPKSKGVLRIDQLKAAILGNPTSDGANDEELRYQLLTASAGALCEAVRNSYPRTLVLVHEFITTKTGDSKHQRNAADLSAFIRRLSKGQVRQAVPGIIYGPFILPGTPIVMSPVKFFIGKVVRRLRETDE